MLHLYIVCAFSLTNMCCPPCLGSWGAIDSFVFNGVLLFLQRAAMHSSAASVSYLVGCQGQSRSYGPNTQMPVTTSLPEPVKVP